jgi:tetratricopeptide (TPR) repeat protein
MGDLYIGASASKMACGMTADIYKFIAEQEAAARKTAAADQKFKRSDPVAPPPAAAVAATAGPSAAKDNSYDWTRTYHDWDKWDDPEDAKPAPPKSTTEATRTAAGGCSHDHTAERRIMDLTEDGKVAACVEFKLRGNALFSEGQYARAALQYRQALIYYDYSFPEGEQQVFLDDLRRVCLVNSAACFIKTRELQEALECCNQVLQEAPQHAKALYRRAQIYRLRDEFEKAHSDVSAALQLAPGDAQLRRELLLLRTRESAYKARSKVLGKQIFAAASTTTTANHNDNSTSSSSSSSGFSSMAQSQVYEMPERRAPRPYAGKDDLYEAVEPAAALSNLTALCSSMTGDDAQDLQLLLGQQRAICSDIAAC